MKKLLVFTMALLLIITGCTKSTPKANDINVSYPKFIPYQKLGMEIPDVGVRIVPLKVQYVTDNTVEIEAALINTTLSVITNLHDAKLKIFDKNNGAIVDTVFQDSDQLRKEKIVPGGVYTMIFKTPVVKHGDLINFGYAGSALYDLSGQPLKSGIYGMVNNENVAIKVDESTQLFVSLEDFAKAIGSTLVTNSQERTYSTKRGSVDIVFKQDNVKVFGDKPYIPATAIQQIVSNSAVNFGRTADAVILSIYIK